MRKGKITITTMQEEGKVFVQQNGYIDRFFGYYRASQSFSVTHLLTGFCVAMFDRASQARKFIQACNETTFPVPWNTSENSEDYRANADIVNSLVSAIKRR